MFVGFVGQSVNFVTRAAIRNQISQKIKVEKEACKRKLKKESESWVVTVMNDTKIIPVGNDTNITILAIHIYFKLGYMRSMYIFSLSLCSRFA